VKRRPIPVDQEVITALHGAPTPPAKREPERASNSWKILRPEVVEDGREKLPPRAERSEPVANRPDIRPSGRSTGPLGQRRASHAIAQSITAQCRGRPPRWHAADRAASLRTRPKGAAKGERKRRCPAPARDSGLRRHGDACRGAQRDQRYLCPQRAPVGVLIAAWVAPAWSHMCCMVMHGMGDSEAAVPYGGGKEDHWRLQGRSAGLARGARAFGVTSIWRAKAGATRSRSVTRGGTPSS
jgi:hypothetical protein